MILFCPRASTRALPGPVTIGRGEGTAYTVVCADLKATTSPERPSAIRAPSSLAL